jgi:hypothetical protein
MYTKVIITNLRLVFNREPDLNCVSALRHGVTVCTYAVAQCCVIVGSES